MTYAAVNTNKNRVKELMDRTGGESSSENDDDEIYFSGEL